MHDLDLAGHVLVHGERVDDAHRVALPQALELGDDLAVELRMLETEHDELYWANGHGSPFGRVTTACDVVVEAVRQARGEVPRRLREVRPQVGRRDPDAEVALAGLALAEVAHERQERSELSAREGEVDAVHPGGTRASRRTAG